MALGLGFLFMAGLGYGGDADSISRRSPVVMAVEKVGPSVVNISTVVQERVRQAFPFSGNDFFRDFFPDFFTREFTRTSLGSGVIIDGARGYIVTNHHVVAKATEIKVITSKKKEFKARILGSAPRSDLAILQIDVKGKPLPEVEMGRSDDLLIGETVIAIGNPFGLSNTVTTGVISAIDRTVRSENRIYRRFIQTDASINPGNSGGPLLNIRGELIGINTAIYQKAQGIGFAIPIDKAKRIVKELFVAGEVRLPWLGLELQELDPKLRAYFNFLDENTGIVLSNVIQGGPGERAGLKRGDILMNIDGIPISTAREYKSALSEFTPSDPVTLKIFRTGKTLSISVQPAVFPLEQALGLVFRHLGIQLGEIDKSTQSQYRLPGRVVVEKVQAGSEANRIGLERGDLLLQINESAIKILDDAKKAITRYRHLTSLTLIIQRGPYRYSLTLPF